MKLFYILNLFVSLMISGISYSQTTVSSGSVSGTWAIGGSPYLIQGDITVPQASTLQIDPGVVVEFQGHYKFNISGSLKAIGTATDSIRFVVPNALINTGWFGLRFNSILTSQDSSILKYSIIKYGKANGINANADGGGIYIYNSPKVRVSNCFVSRNQANGNGGGIYFTLCSPLISYNSIISNTCALSGGGICGLSGTSSTIMYNNIADNIGTGNGGGIYCGPSTTIKVNYNIIKNNSSSYGGGISLGASANVTIYHDSIINNYSSGPGGGIYADDSNSGIFSYNVINYNNSGNAGGGVSCSTHNTTQIKNNTINNNYAGGGGGIVIGNNSTINIQDNTIENNTVAGNGAGIYISSASSSAGGVVTGNVINNNSATLGGGGIYANFCAQSINSNTITNNMANSGGGIYLSPASWNHEIKGNIISGNVTVNQGGGIYADHDDGATITENIISNNTGGIYLTSPFGHGITYNFSTYIKQNFITNNYKNGGITLNLAGAEIKSNVICNNSNDLGGGGISAINSTFYVLNCTISNNKSNDVNEGGGGIYCSQTTSTKFINCIITGNSAPSGNGSQVFLKDSNSDPIFQSCNIENGKNGFYTNGFLYTGSYTGNMDTITHFVAPSAGAGNTFNGLTANWRLKIISPCLNTGIGSMYYLATDKDIVGNNRKIDIAIDRGAFEFDSCFQTTINPLVSFSGSSISSMQAGASSYTWLDCNDSMNPLPSTGSLQTITVQSGNYAVIVNKFGCIDTSACVVVLITGIAKSKMDSKIEIFPNPVSDHLVIVNNEFTISEIIILDITGKKIKQFMKTSNIIDVSDLPAGIYFLKLNTNEGILTRKFIKE